MLNPSLYMRRCTVVVANLLVWPLCVGAGSVRPFSAGHLRGYDGDAVPVARCEMIVAMDVVGDAKDGSQMRGLNVVYYVTLLALAAGLTALLGYEIGWLAARSKVSLVMAGTMVPWAVFVAWAVSDV